VRGNDAGQMRGGARADDEDLDAARRGLLDQPENAGRRPMRRRHGHFPRQPKLGERLTGRRHDRRVGVGTHQDQHIDRHLSSPEASAI
jgi:hypothetical protein